ncbi:DinB family protein [Bacillus sp. AK128]
MNMQELLKGKREILDWVKDLEDIDEQLWFQPIGEGKWAIADVISHFISWDRFCMEYRMPFMDRALPFPKLDVNVDHVNRTASVYARSGITKNQLIEEHNQTRGLLLSVMEEWPEERFGRVIKLGSTEMKVQEYFSAHIDHDRKHMEKINNFLKRTTTSGEIA